MASGDAPRQRTRVGGGVTSSSSAGNLAGMVTATPPLSMSPASSPSPRLKVQQATPIPDVQRPTSGQQMQFAASPTRLPTPPLAAVPQQVRVEAAAARPTAPIAAVPQQIRVEAAPARPQTPPAAKSAAAQPAYTSSGYSMPEPPAPRSWTPSKLGGRPESGGGSGSGSPARSMTPREALEQEMQELTSIDPASAGFVQQRPHSSNTINGMAAYRNPYFDSAPGASTAEGAGVGLRPASVGGVPRVPQHNNLMVSSPRGAGNARPGSSGSSRASREDYLTTQLGLNLLKSKLTGRGDEPGSTTVQAFSEPSSIGVAASDSSDPVIVARRRGTAPARLQPSSYSHTTAQWEQEAMALLTAGDRLAVLQLPGPSTGVVRCYVKRISNMLGVAQHFELRLEATDECLAVARRRVKSATSSYVIGLSASGCGSNSGSSTPSSARSQQQLDNGSSSPLRRDDPEVVGKLKANMMGTEYLLTARGGDSSTHKGFNAQLLAVNYKPTINHIQAAPRTMTAILPVPESRVWDGSQPPAGQFDSLMTCMEAARERQLPPAYERDLVMLHTMKPHFDAVKQVHYLDFKGRVREVSLKNFQLVHWDHNRNQLGTDLVLLFGKKEHSEYAVDFCYPMNALQAFALGLSSIDTKLCYAV